MRYACRGDKIMRPIKFRGKRKDNGKWVYGYYGKDKDGKTWIYYLWATFDTSMLNSFIDVDPQTVGQFTGLLDKNGKEIYEGDIVKVPSIFSDRPSEIYEIRYSEHGFDLASKTNNWPKREDGYSYYGTSWEKIEVIGNIHESSELLKE
jgi:uncharacterized phage protein (TIGR01671 family)